MLSSGIISHTQIHMISAPPVGQGIDRRRRGTRRRREGGKEGLVG